MNTPKPPTELELIHTFLKVHPLYVQLASEVAYCLEKSLRATELEYSSVTHRAKSLDSFVSKISRKHYKNPFADISDLAAVRVVHLYKTDAEKIEGVINREFKVLEKVSSVTDQGDDRFGYAAVHFVIQLGASSTGARYDDLKELKCEIQVRTAVQDAWAIINHHLFYKREQDIPRELRRKINSLAGLLETADDQFDQVRLQRAEYVRQVEASLQRSSDGLSQDINADTVAAFLKRVFPEEPEGDSAHVGMVLEDLNREKYRTLADLKDVLDRTQVARAEYDKVMGEKLRNSTATLAVALGLDDSDYRDRGWEPDSVEAFELFEDLVVPKSPHQSSAQLESQGRAAPTGTARGFSLRRPAQPPAEGT